MDRGYNQGYGQQGQHLGETGKGEEEVVEFHSEMPRVPDEGVEFIPDEKLEEEITEEI